MLLKFREVGQFFMAAYTLCVIASEAWQSPRLNYKHDCSATF